ncbi:LysM peptidoglycan-binding domain-containing protein [Agromyces aurantiacus]|uniref:LysM peptidoglycan-binding domain-containing protein n=1 Tax=Agromyces aurantiacus TaxID=165814 RepID=A0ABV9R854_9MICO|nr:LysM domain-containing protein [Agromyces aurantiacus]MBM7504748.1 LysM repeat protein [Agromyces aurantiacus]
MRPMRTARRRTGALALAVALAGSMGACAVGGDSAVRVSPTAVASAAPERGPAIDTEPDDAAGLSDLTPGTLIASGEFDGRGTTGRIEIRANGEDHGFEIALADVTPAPAAGMSLELNALPVTASDAELQQGFSYYRYDALATSPDQAFSTPGPGYGGFETSDPTYLRTAVIWAAPEGASIGLGSVVATAELAWSLPDLGPSPDLIDLGDATGARGEVGTSREGVPVNYRVAPGDTIDGIGTRFGLTMDQLAWLNPDRSPGRLVLAGITLNLSAESRGLRW